jgi:PRTRC genetic system ThiF family protein
MKSVKQTFNLPEKWLGKPINITLVGAGGTGSALLTELFQMSFLLNEVSNGTTYLNVVVFDDDEVSHSNIGRQAFYCHDVNNNKAETLVNRLNNFGGANWTAIPERFTPEMLPNNTNILITCVDSAKVRADIGNFYKKTNYNKQDPILWLDTGNGSDSGQCIFGGLHSKGSPLPNVFDLYPSLSSIKDVPTDSCSHIEAVSRQDYGINKKVALEASGLLWQLIRHGSLQRHGAIIDIKDGTTIPIPIDPNYWSMLGFTQDVALTH